ncbi:hypothetical protein LIN78_17300 [Leeia sp. TBRC 13508]|uniref:Uncharacterized protein n=1 Tax=Leeia speluncae TaxID=2884804 RepID=A0ABS8DBK6_9NEIS|nr:hypothetical protein [Leeia speluncae]MCB6185306.1 hypothetical protein [Leeia speluncae]
MLGIIWGYDFSTRFDMRVSDPRTITAFPFSAEYPELANWLSQAGSAPINKALIEELFFEGKSEVIGALLAALPAKERLQCWKAVAAIADGTGTVQRDDGKLVRLFAIPLVIVAGSRQPYTIPALLPNPLEMRALLVEHGVMDSSNHVWMSGELVDLESLGKIKNDAWYQAHLATTLATQGFPFNLTPSDVLVESQERVHLRFIVGIVVEDASRQRARIGDEVGKWGIPFGQLLQKQWQKEGMTLFVMPRALTGVVAGQYDARFTTLEVAFHLFASSIIRRIREGVGDPAVILSVHENAEIRVTIQSRLQQDVVERFVWPLDPKDHIPSVFSMMHTFFTECQVSDIILIDRCLPATVEEGIPFFPCLDDLEGDTTH